MTQYFLGMYPREEGRTSIKACTRMFIAASFTIGGNNPKVYHLSIDKLWCVCTMERYLAIKRNDVPYVPQHGEPLKALCSVEEARHKTSHTVWFHLYETPRIGKSTDRKHTSGFQAIGSDYLWIQALFGGVIGVFWNWTVVMAAQPYEYKNTQQVVYFKMLDFMLCKILLYELYFNKNKKLKKHEESTDTCRKMEEP